MTIICGRSRLDVALPTGVPSSDLLPQLCRLMTPDDPPDESQPWAFSTAAGRVVADHETLSTVGVLAGEMLILAQRPGGLRPAEAMVTTRDRIEDVVNGRDRFWGAPTSRGLAHWAALLTAVALLLPMITLPVGYATAGIAATAAILVALTAVLSDRRSEKVCAAVGLVVGCGWAAVAGAYAAQAWSASTGQLAVAMEPVGLLLGVVSALLLAACTAASYPTALIHTTALLVVGVVVTVSTLAINAGSTVVDTACATGVVAVLVLGGLAWLALATGGLTGVERGRDPADLDARITRADRVLIGCLIGVSLVAVGGAVPAALADASGPRVVAGGIGLLLLLRSRSYSQTTHVLPPRIGGALVFAALWLGLYLQDASLKSVLILLGVLGTAALAALLAVIDRAPSPVADARSGRLLDLAEQLLVVGLIVWTAGVLVIFDWMTAVGA